ncbi:MAG: hypothetical protein ACYC6Y_18970, partial [Thermoguttaceae bacterium]
ATHFLATMAAGSIGVIAALLVLSMLSPADKPPETAARTDPVNQQPKNPDATPPPDRVTDPDAAPGPTLEGSSPTVPPTQPLPTGPAGATTPLSPPPDPLPSPPAPIASPVQGTTPTATPAPASWPTPLPGSPPPMPSFPSTQPSVSQPSVSQPAAPGNVLGNSLPGTTAADVFSGTPKAILLDLDRSAMYVPLAENTEGQVVRVHVRGITNVATSYDLQPADGMLGVGQPVDVVLTQYAGVKLRLSLRTRGKNTELEVAPEIQIGRGKTSDFSKGALDLLSRSTKKDALALNKQLGAAQAEAVEIQNWLVSPIAKTIPLRNARVQRLTLLMNQAIPSLQKDLTDAQARLVLIQQLSLLVDQIHKKASLDLAVQAQPAAK